METPRDPTQTLTLRSRTLSNLNARFDRIKREVLEAFSLGDYTGKPWPFVEDAPLAGGGVILTNAKRPKKKRPKAGYKKPSYKLSRVTGSPSVLGPEDKGSGYVYQRNEANLFNFDKWIQQLIDREILQPKLPLADRWLSKSLGSAYTKGASNSRRVAGKALAKVMPNPLGTSNPLNHPAHLSRARMIYLRSFNDMEGVTNVMKTQMRRILSEGIIAGKNPNAIGKELADRIDKIGKVRGRLIARTEIVRSHQEAAIQEAENLEAETGYAINMEWDTCLDGRERDTHRARNGKIYTKEVCLTMLGEPNCRCSVNPHVTV